MSVVAIVVLFHSRESAAQDGQVDLARVSAAGPLEELHLLHLLSSHAPREYSHQVDVDVERLADVLEAVDEERGLEEPALRVDRELAELEVSVVAVEGVVECSPDDGLDPEQANGRVALRRWGRQAGRQLPDIDDYVIVTVSVSDVKMGGTGQKIDLGRTRTMVTVPVPVLYGVTCVDPFDRMMLKSVGSE
jgi:hypothetical protein